MATAQAMGRDVPLRSVRGQSTAIPWGAVSVIAAVQFGEAFQLTVLLPFVPFMVSDFDEVPEEHVRAQGLNPACGY